MIATCNALRTRSRGELAALERIEKEHIRRQKEEEKQQGRAATRTRR